MNGTSWTSFGTYGTGVGQFVNPQSISIDPTGHIWVLDSGHGLVRIGLQAGEPADGVGE